MRKREGTNCRRRQNPSTMGTKTTTTVVLFRKALTGMVSRPSTSRVRRPPPAMRPNHRPMTSTSPVRSTAAPMMNMNVTVRMALFPKMSPRIAAWAFLSPRMRMGVPSKGTTSSRKSTLMDTMSGETFSHMNIATVTSTRTQTKI